MSGTPEAAWLTVSCEVALMVPLLLTRKLRPKEMKNVSRLLYLMDGRTGIWKPKATLFQFISQDRVSSRGMKSPEADWPCYRLWGNSNVSILMFPLKSYPLAERPGRWQMSPLSSHPSQVINHIQALGCFPCSGKEDGSAPRSVRRLGCFLELTGKCTLFTC